MASKATPVQSLHLQPSAMGHHPRAEKARRRRLVGAISATLALLLEVTKPVGKW
jgi:hypothetical protein